MFHESFQYFMPVRALYGVGLLSRIGQEVGEFKGLKALVITDQILEKLGVVEKLRKGLEGSGVEIAAVFSDVPPNSEVKTVKAAAELGKNSGCNLLIAIGGGSVMDTAKVTNVLMFKGGEVEDHMGAQLVDEKMYPMIFVPTTAGTGSEATIYAMISDTAKQVKLPFAEDRFLPDLAILDPELTVSMPPKVTASTGMDALTHAIESYVSTTASPISRAFSLQAIDLISKYILAATAHPDDMTARGAMLTASFLAGVAINHAGVGMVHALSHAAGGVYHIPHGVANAIFLPFSIDYNLDVAAEDYARISEVLGELNVYPIHELQANLANFENPIIENTLSQLSFVDEWLAKRKAAALAEKIRRLNRQLAYLSGLPLNLKEAGVNDNLAQLDLLVERGMEDGSLLYNPKEVKENDMREIFQKAYHQNLKPEKVSEKSLKLSAAGHVKKRIKGVFKSAEELYDILGGFFERIRENDELREALVASGLVVRFRYTNPDAAIVLASIDGEQKIIMGEEAEKMDVELELKLEADLAHVFWHGQMNVVQALARREVIPKGNLPKAMKLLPILDPAFRMYPEYLREKGLSSLIL
ncbi:MAG: iron-containing alcohol dehydrogenase [Candidatus Hydrogenedentota bacterium]|nr:MAG: iron-containing alcohol dehydrogenase [Candidatus Hydrogenedentota bacterium]